MSIYKIRRATLEDVEQIAQLEEACFPPKEAASESSFLQRLKVYANHFLVLEEEGKIVSMVNGMVTEEEDLKDEMYSNAQLHNENGKWQMIFGVATHPDWQKKGLAQKVLKEFIAIAKKENRKGLVLTCKEKLIPYYEKFGFVNEGISSSEHGAVVWYQMRLVL